MSAYLAVIQARGVLPTLPWLASLPLSVLAFRDRPSLAWGRRDSVIAVCLFGVALLSRLLFIDRWPSVFHPDEPIHGLIAVDLLAGQAPAFIRGWLQNPYTSMIPFAIGLELFGRSVPAVRVPVGFIGAVAIPLLYGLGREAYGRIVGFFAAVFLLLNVAAFHLSRTGLPNVQAITLLILGACAFICVTKDPERPRQWATLGLTLGLCLCVYPSAFVWPPTAALAVAPIVPRLIRHNELLRRAAWPLIVCAIVAAAPLLVNVAAKPADLTAHAMSMQVWNKDAFDHEIDAYHLQNGDVMGVWRNQVVRTFSGLISLGDSQGDYGSERGLLDPVAAVGFILGLAVLVRQWRRPGSWLLLSWVSLSLVLGSIIIEDPPQATKLFIMVPAACLIAGIGLERLLASLLGTGRAHWIAVGGSACIVAGAVVGFSYYFGRYQVRMSQDTTLLARYAESIQADRALYLVNLGIPPGYEAIRYLAPNARVHAWATKDPPPGITAGVRLAFAMSYEGSDGAAALTTVKALYPSGSQRTLFDTNDVPILRIWEVPAAPTSSG